MDGGRIVGKRGPARTPTEVKDREGTRKKSRDPDPIPVEHGLPSCPFGPGPEADTWNLLLEVMRASHLHEILTRADEGTLEGAAVAWCRARWASGDVAALTTKGRYVHTKSNGLRPHPAIAEERAAWAEFRRFAGDLGLSPSARSSISSATQQVASAGGDMDELTRLLQAAGPAPVADDD
jgi:phage terminase small subunit